MSISHKALSCGLMALLTAAALSACSPAAKKAEAPASDSAAAAPATGVAKNTFNIGWSIYAGWMPWPYAEQAGIVKKWEDKYGIKINIIQVNDYVESINQYTAGKLDGVTVTNMDALTIPAAGGKDTSAIIIGDYSNGNDGIIMKDAKSLSAIKGQTVNLVEFSVSHYLLARGLEMSGLKLSDVKTVNTGDADIVSAFASPDIKNVVTWNPQLSQLKKVKGATEVFDSSKIPGEILDLMAVDTATLKANPKLGKALAGIWFDTMKIMTAKTPEGAKARAAMAALSGTTPADFDSQLSTTYLYATPDAAVKEFDSQALEDTMDKVRKFSFAKGLYGPSATSVDAIGIAFPGNKTLGDASHVTLRFDPTYTEEAENNTL
ncbi:putative urea ABC transporter substrate-binding protein [Asticcacaulis sp. EMRT-3]|uniref:putative urea ABC transporter substrate-binding protein n=1 Tax=Asticcacaulis sp. EMRT-3 TaxID=3040349 RepID=UPI0024AF416B|nr:putative urea ABC transporter substrate-binding protein [Asticcacaulis sp. EMRT-3]MDI7776653.1 putative urea ABC transporter substrate-binding protein [Asticcacaulis sp. EMRT-3]